MAKVDKVALEHVLRQLESRGLIRGWQPRPLNMYMVSVIADEVMRLDLKETAMWAQGVLYAAAAEQARSALAEDRGLDREAIREGLDALKDQGVLCAWELDDDEDYALTYFGGEQRSYYARDISAFVGGVFKGHLAGLASADRSVKAVRSDVVSPLLDSLEATGVLDRWQEDEEGDFFLVVPGTEGRWVMRSDITSWIDGAMSAFRTTRVLDEERKGALRGLLSNLRSGGLLNSWEAEEWGDYRIWTSGADEPLKLCGQEALLWAMGAAEASTQGDKEHG